MKNWLASRNGAIVLSLIALLTLLARSYYDVRFILTEEYSSLAPWMDVLWIYGFTAFLGLNMLALLLAASGDGRGAWVTLLVFNLITGLGSGVASLLVFTSSTLEFVIFTSCLIAGLLAALAVGFRLQRGRVTTAGTVG